MTDEKEIIEEIYEYYKDKRDAEEDDFSPISSAYDGGGAEPEKKTEKKQKRSNKPILLFNNIRISQMVNAFLQKMTTVREFIKKQYARVVAFIIPKMKDILADRRKRLALYAAGAFVASWALGTLIGLIIPKNTAKTAELTDRLKEENAEYIELANNNDKLNEKVDELYDERAELRVELSSITDYEDMRDETENRYGELSDRLEELQGEITKKQEKADALNTEIALSGNGELTLTPGIYTVGQHIAVGEYIVTGKGSLLVSDTNSKLKINTKLSSAGYKCGLSEGDTIKLEASAKFNPEN